MAFILNVDCKAYEGGPVIPVRISGVPVDEHEAIKMGLGRAMYDGYIRSLTIAKQAKARQSYKSPNGGTKTRAGSAVSQAAAARREAMREAAELARLEAEAAAETGTETETEIEENVGS